MVQTLLERGVFGRVHLERNRAFLTQTFHRNKIFSILEKSPSLAVQVKCV